MVKKSGAGKEKKAAKVGGKFTINCTAPVEDEILDIAAFVSLLCFSPACLDRVFLDSFF